MDQLIARIRMAAAAVGYCDTARDAVHEAIVLTNKQVTEEDFFLAWHAARILDSKVTHA